MSQFKFDVPPFRLSGTVYGTLLNSRETIDATGETVHQAPYKAPPKAPGLYLKPRSTLASAGDDVTVPAGVGQLQAERAWVLSLAAQLAGYPRATPSNAWPKVSTRRTHIDAERR